LLARVSADLSDRGQATAWFAALFAIEPGAVALARQAFLEGGYSVGPSPTEVAELAGMVVAQRVRQMGPTGVLAGSTTMPGWPTVIVNVLGRSRLHQIERMNAERLRNMRSRDLPSWLRDSQYDPELAALLYDIAYAQPSDSSLHQSITTYFPPSADPVAHGVLTSTLSDVLSDPNMDVVDRGRLLESMQSFALVGGSERVAAMRAAFAILGGVARMGSPPGGFRAGSSLSPTMRRRMGEIRAAAAAREARLQENLGLARASGLQNLSGGQLRLGEGSRPGGLGGGYVPYRAPDGRDLISLRPLDTDAGDALRGLNWVYQNTGAGNFLLRPVGVHVHNGEMRLLFERAPHRLSNYHMQRFSDLSPAEQAMLRRLLTPQVYERGVINQSRVFELDYFLVDGAGHLRMGIPVRVAQFVDEVRAGRIFRLTPQPGAGGFMIPAPGSPSGAIPLAPPVPMTAR
jgi:hypothetical protein